MHFISVLRFLPRKSKWNLLGAIALTPLLASAQQTIYSDSFDSFQSSEWSNYDGAPVTVSDGSGSLSNALQVGSSSGGGIVRQIPTVAGETYSLSYLGRLTDSNSGATIGITIYDSNGNEITRDSTSIATTSHETYTGTFEIPSNANSSYLWIWTGGGNGRAIIDDISITSGGGGQPEPGPETGGSTLYSNTFSSFNASQWDNYNGAPAVVNDGSGGLSQALQVGTYSGGGIVQGIPIAAGETYTLSHRGRTTDQSTTVWVGLTFYDGNGNEIAKTNTSINSQSHETYTVSLLAPTNATSAYVWIWSGGGSGVGIIDDLFVSTDGSGGGGDGGGGGGSGGGDGSGGDLLPNGGFENGIGNWQTNGSPDLEIISGGHNSNQAIRLAGGGGDGGIALQVDSQNFSGGSDYELSLFAKNASSSWAGFGIFFYDAAGNSLSVAPQGNIPNSNTYTESKINFTAPTNATQAWVWIWKSSGSGDLDVDNVALTSSSSSGGGGGGGSGSGNNISTGDRLYVDQSWTQWGQQINESREARISVQGSTSQPLPVVIAFHGNGDNGQKALNDWSHLQNVILVGPYGYNTAWNATHEGSEAPDVAFVENIISQLEGYDNVDTSEVSLIGYSNGSALVNRLLIELPSWITVRGVCLASPLNEDQYRNNQFWYSPDGQENFDTPINPPSGRRILSISGDNDQIVPYFGGPDIDGFIMIPAEQSAYIWAQHNGYSGPQIPSGSGVYEYSDAIRYDYGTVRHYRLLNADHSLQTNGSQNTMKTIVEGFLAE